jgi:hypothetical protein
MSFAEAEAAEQGIEHIFDAGPARQPIEGRTRKPQLLRKEYDVLGRCRRCERLRCLGDVRRLAPIERDCAVGRKNRAGKPSDLLQ